MFTAKYHGTVCEQLLQYLHVMSAAVHVHRHLCQKRSCISCLLLEYSYCVVSAELAVADTFCFQSKPATRRSRVRNSPRRRHHRRQRAATTTANQRPAARPRRRCRPMSSQQQQQVSPELASHWFKIGCVGRPV